MGKQKNKATYRGSSYCFAQRTARPIFPSSIVVSFVAFFRKNWRLKQETKIWQSEIYCFIKIMYVVQYASFVNFCSISQNFHNFDLAAIFIVMHYLSSYISVNSCNTLGSLSISGISQLLMTRRWTNFKGTFLLLTQFWPNFKGRFLGPSLTNANCQLSPWHLPRQQVVTDSILTKL